MIKSGRASSRSIRSLVPSTPAAQVKPNAVMMGLDGVHRPQAWVQTLLRPLLSAVVGDRKRFYGGKLFLSGGGMHVEDRTAWRESNVSSDLAASDNEDLDGWRSGSMKECADSSFMRGGVCFIMQK